MCRYMRSASFGGLEIENMNGVMSGIIEVKPPPIKTTEVRLMYEFRYVKGHIEVFLDGEFQFSADTISEARKELEQE